MNRLLTARERWWLSKLGDDRLIRLTHCLLVVAKSSLPDQEITNYGVTINHAFLTEANHDPR